MQNYRWKIVIGSLLGSLAIQMLTFACTGGSGSGSTTTASAQESTCTQWETRVDKSPATDTVVQAPPGWEPFSVSISATTYIASRRCIAP